LQGAQIPAKFLTGVVLHVGRVMSQRAAVERVAVGAELRPDLGKGCAGLGSPALLPERDRLPDARHDLVDFGLPALVRGS
jgi:hypothetical protein